MAIDASIYAQFAPRQRSVAEYAGDFAQLDAQKEALKGNALARAFNQAKFEEFGRQRQEANALRQFQRGLGGKSESDVLKAYRDAGYFSEAGALEGEMLKRDKTRAEITGEGVKAAKDEALTTKAFGEAQADALKRFRGALDFVDTPQGAQRWLQAQYADPLLQGHMSALGPIEQAITRVPTDPAAFQQWRQQAGMGMESWLKQQLEATKAAETAANNVRTDERVRSEGAANRGVTVRGQNMTDARAKDTASAAQFIPVEGVGLYVGDKKTGTARPVTDQGGQPIVPQKAPPQFAVEGAQAAVKAMGSIDKALQMLETPAGKGGVGLKNMAPGAIGRAAINKLDPDGVDVRAAIADIGSLEIKNRSGATVTIGEEPRLIPFIPVPTDSAEVAAKKLKRLRETVQADYQVLGEFYPGVKKKGDAAAARASPASGFKYLGTE